MSHHVRPNRLRVSGSSFQQIGKGKDAMTIRSTCITCRYTTSAEINIDNLVEIFGQAVNKHDYYSMLATLDKKLDDEITDIAKNNPDELIDEDDVEASRRGPSLSPIFLLTDSSQENCRRFRRCK